MAGIITALGTVAKVASIASEEGVSAKTLHNLLKSNELKLLRSDGSLMKVLGKYLVEPVAVVSIDLKEDEIIDRVLSLHTDMFTAFYMQVFDILRAGYGIDGGTAIDALSTDTGGLGRVAVGGLGLAVEDRDFMGELFRDDFTLTTEASRRGSNARQQQNASRGSNTRRQQNPTTGTNTPQAPAPSTGTTPPQGQNTPQAPAPSTGTTPPQGQNTPQGSPKSGGKTHTSRGRTSSLASTGKDLMLPNAIIRTVDVTMGGKDSAGNTFDIIVPITIKLHVIYTTMDNIINVIEPNSEDKTFGARLDDYRSGAISMGDLVFATDIIMKYKKNKLADTDKLLDLINTRRLSANSKVVDNGFVGFEKYYNMYIISSDNKAALERHLRGKLKSTKTKQKFLDQANGLSITVLDQDYERIRISLRDTRGESDLTYKAALKAGDKGADMTEMVKALMTNKPPVF